MPVATFYGTTYSGGDGQGGTVFELAPDGTETVLYSFSYDHYQASPSGPVIMDGAGNLYGTISWTTGAVFEIAPDGTETTLYNFCSQTNCADGEIPWFGLTLDSGDNLYGVTLHGGGPGCDGNDGNGCGTVFEVTLDGTEAALYNFTQTRDGPPSSGVIFDGSGNLYGEAQTPSGNGEVYKLAPDGTETVLYAFKGGTSDGSGPLGGLIMDNAGNLYGSTVGGGTHGTGVVFKLTPGGSETILGSAPKKLEGIGGGVVADPSGNFFGVGGGGMRCKHGRCGTVFKLTE